jgi:hypothetical protein
VSLTLSIIESARTVDDEHFNIGGEILKILQGNAVLYSYLVNLIDDFDKKNYAKYSDIKYLQRLKKEKEKIKIEKDKKNVKNKKDGKEDSKEDTKEKDNIINEEKEYLNNNPRDFHKKNTSIINYNPRKNLLLKKESTDQINNNIILEQDIEEDFTEKEKEKEHQQIKNKLKKSISFDTSKVNKMRTSSQKSLDEFLQLSENEENDNKEIDELNEKYKNKRYIKLDQPYDEMFFPHLDYKDLKEMIREDFFNNYCSRKRIILMLIKSIFRFSV